MFECHVGNLFAPCPVSGLALCKLLINRLHRFLFLTVKLGDISLCHAIPKLPVAVRVKDIAAVIVGLVELLALFFVFFGYFQPLLLIGHHIGKHGIERTLVTLAADVSGNVRIILQHGLLLRRQVGNGKIQRCPVGDLFLLCRFRVRVFPFKDFFVREGVNHILRPAVVLGDEPVVIQVKLRYGLVKSLVHKVYALLSDVKFRVGLGLLDASGILGYLTVPFSRFIGYALPLLGQLLGRLFVFLGCLFCLTSRIVCGGLLLVGGSGIVRPALQEFLLREELAVYRGSHRAGLSEGREPFGKPFQFLDVHAFHPLRNFAADLDVEADGILRVL